MELNTAQARHFLRKGDTPSNATSIVDETSCSSTQQLSGQVEELYCNVEDELMIGYDDNCPYEWLDVGCVGLDCIPQGEWYCANCAQSNHIKLYMPNAEQLHCMQVQYNKLCYAKNIHGITDMSFRYNTC